MLSRRISLVIRDAITILNLFSFHYRKAYLATRIDTYLFAEPLDNLSFFPDNATNFLQ